MCWPHRVSNDNFGSIVFLYFLQGRPAIAMWTVTALELSGHLGQAAPQNAQPALELVEQERGSRQGCARFLSTGGGGVTTWIK